MEGLFACPDYDDVRFGIDYSKERETLMFSFRIPNFAELFAIAGEYFLNKHYPCNYLNNDHFFAKKMCFILKYKPNFIIVY